MGLVSETKEFFCDIFGIETKEEKAIKTKEAPMPDQAPTSDKEKEAKEEEEHQGADVSEPLKFVCQSGKAQCTFCNPPMADIIVRSSTIMLQDKPWATIKDKDGKVNFNFTGVCTHPSQQKPGAPPPPCKAVISLGEWKDFSETMVGDNNALLVKSTIPCMISGQDLKITDSGQRAVLSELEPEMMRGIDITEMYWMNEDQTEILEDIQAGQTAYLLVRTKDFTEGEEISIPVIDDEDNNKEYTLTGNVDSKGIARIKWIQLDK